MFRRAVAIGPLMVLAVLVSACVGGVGDGEAGVGEVWPVWEPGSPPDGTERSEASSGERVPDLLVAWGLGGGGPDTGRFHMTVAYGLEGHYHVESEAWGAFDRRAGSSEFGVHLEPFVDQLHEWGLADLPEEVSPYLVVRTVDGAVYISVEVGEAARWIALGVDPGDASPELGMVQPDDLLAMVAAVAHEVEVAAGPTIDGTPTRHYQGWLRSGAFEAISSQEGAGGVGELMDGAPPGLFDRLMRFDAWVGDDGVARRLLIELDHEGMLDMAEVVDGYRDPSAPRVTIRHEVEWLDVNLPVHLAAPGPDEIVAEVGGAVDR